MSSLRNHIGAQYFPDGSCSFRVWAPLLSQVEVHLLSPPESFLPMVKEGEYHYSLIPEIAPGTLYYYRLSGNIERPDPASRFQPQGVHGPSQVVDLNFSWADQDWIGIPLWEYIIYEIHVGTFTPQGTFAAIIPYLDQLKNLGITAIELMPVAQFPGTRNWGYDGGYPFAVQDSYGAPGIKKNWSMPATSSGWP